MNIGDRFGDLVVVEGPCFNPLSDSQPRWRLCFEYDSDSFKGRWSAEAHLLHMWLHSVEWGKPYKERSLYYRGAFYGGFFHIFVKPKSESHCLLFISPTGSEVLEGMEAEVHTRFREILEYAGAVCERDYLKWAQAELSRNSEFKVSDALVKDLLKQNEAMRLKLEDS